ncbi:hypothetical protein K2173_006805 [Erythroxylum novogranatense]|uniref:FAD synthase n=1 Tax=Erythroxylum novogranatense TaxID=1862640 RepID=A0AAV8SZ60_9ROSI|nr:hypothetical protein K2173_006805 [Erythroxylum novogranatense]
MLAGGSRIASLQCNHRANRRSHHQVLGLGARIVQLSSFILKKSSSTDHQLQHRTLCCSSLRSKPPGETPILSDCFSQQEESREFFADEHPSVAGGVVALGKFDALHIGHRELAIQASKVGTPFLLSFVGMAEVLGWEPRPPVVAKCDRSRVLSSWASYCGDIAPAEFQIEFSSVRHLTPRQFVEKLAKDLRVCGVVAGENYRFGYKAAGDVSELVRLCEEYDLGAYIVNSVMDKNHDPRNMDLSDLKERGQVSSTRVRHALAVGDIKYVSELLGRKHRLMLMLKDLKDCNGTSSRWKVSAPKSCLLNLPPKDGLYENCSLVVGNDSIIACRVFIDRTHIHLEMDEEGLSSKNSSQDFQLLGIEFGD